MVQFPSLPRAEGLAINTTAKKPQFYSLNNHSAMMPCNRPLAPIHTPSHTWQWGSQFLTFVLTKSNKGKRELCYKKLFYLFLSPLWLLIFSLSFNHKAIDYKMIYHLSLSSVSVPLPFITLFSRNGPSGDCISCQLLIVQLS